MRIPLLVLSSALLLSGCVSMSTRSYQMIRVDTPGVIGADCKLTTPTNYYRVVTPGFVQVDRNEDTLHVECKKVQYITATLAVKPKTNMGGPSMALNVLNGVVPGATYDIANKVVHEYPHAIEIPMEVDPYAVMAAKEDDAPEETPPVLDLRHADEPELPPALMPDFVPAEETMSKALRK